MPSYFESGKGSLQRPEDHKKFSDNFDLIFKKNKEPVAEAQQEEKVQEETKEGLNK